jgi:hypothetical protein
MIVRQQTGISGNRHPGLHSTSRSPAMIPTAGALPARILPRLPAIHRESGPERERVRDRQVKDTHLPRTARDTRICIKIEGTLRRILTLSQKAATDCGDYLSPVVLLSRRNLTLLTRHYIISWRTAADNAAHSDHNLEGTIKRMGLPG